MGRPTPTIEGSYYSLVWKADERLPAIVKETYMLDLNR